MSSEKIEMFKKEMFEMIGFAEQMCKPHHVDYSNDVDKNYNTGMMEIPQRLLLLLQILLVAK